MCEKYPKLNELYDLLNNKGYGTKKHIEGIKTHGITIWHEKLLAYAKHLILLIFLKINILKYINENYS